MPSPPSPSPGRKPVIAPELLTAAVEKPQKTGTRQTSLRIGLPRETNEMENRVPLTPRTVGVLVANGHEVYVEHRAGSGAQYSDAEFTAHGAVIVYNRAELYQRVDVVCTISPPDAATIPLLRKGQTVISALNIGSVTADYLQGLMERGVTAIGFEFVRSPDGTVPFMQLMSQIAGIASINIAAELLSRSTGGKGLLLGSITGVPPVTVTIVGAGTVGTNACRTALALGAQVRVLDEEVSRLQEIERVLGQKLHTSVASPDAVLDAVVAADVLIGAAYISGYRAPVVVTEDMVLGMREGSVIVDVSIDQGGCVETSRRTTHKQPTFVHEGIIHYCVPNIASRVPRTGSEAISNLLGPMLLKLGRHGGVKNSLGREASITNGIYVYHRHVTQRSLADLFGLSFMDIELLYAANM